MSTAPVTEPATSNEPELITDNIASGNYTDGMATSSVTSTETDSHTEWRSIVFLLQWAIGLLLLIIFLFFVVKSGKKSNQRRINDHAVPDLEDQTNNSNDIVTKNIAPTNAFKIVGLLSALLALGNSIAAIVSCEFVSLDWGSASISASDPETIGLWSVQYENYLSYGGTCQAYNKVPEIPPYPIDINLGVARAASVIAVLFGGLAMFGLVYYFAVSSSSSMLGTVITVTFLFTWIAQSSTLSIFGTKYCTASDAPLGGCELDYGGLASATAIYFWFLAFIACKAENIQQTKK